MVLQKIFWKQKIPNGTISAWIMGNDVHNVVPEVRYLRCYLQTLEVTRDSLPPLPPKITIGTPRLDKAQLTVLEVTNLGLPPRYLHWLTGLHERHEPPG